MKFLCLQFGPQDLVRDLAELGVEDVLQYDPYEDKSQNSEIFSMMDKEPEVTPEWRDKYVNAEILLLRGDKISRDQVVCWIHDANGNPIGRFNQNPISDMHLFEIEFPGGEIIELSVNIIAESVYAQCDVYGNEYLLLVASINHKKMDQFLVDRTKR